MTQAERILAYLSLNQSMCSMLPLTWTPLISRTAARIQDLRDGGHQITSRPCVEHGSGHVTYELVGKDRLF